MNLSAHHFREFYISHEYVCVVCAGFRRLQQRKEMRN